MTMRNADRKIKRAKEALDNYIIDNWPRLRLSEIAENLRMDVTVVGKMAEDLDLYAVSFAPEDPRPTMVPLAKIDAFELRKRFSAGEPVAEIAKSIGIGEDRCKRLINNCYS